MYKEILEKSVISWLGSVVKDVMPAIKNTPKTTMVNNIMGALLGVDLGRYNIMSELSFMIPQLFESNIKSGIDNMIQTLGIKDEDIPCKLQEIISLCKIQAQGKGSVNIFGIEFTSRSFQKFEDIFREYMENTNMR